MDWRKCTGSLFLRFLRIEAVEEDLGANKLMEMLFNWTACVESG